MNDALARRIADIDLSKHPEWYRERLTAAIRYLGPKWLYSPIIRRRTDDDAIESRLEDREYGDRRDEARAEGLAVRR